MKNKLFALLTGLLSVHAVAAQVSWDLENKYWTYRDRYRNYFTKIGSEAGESQSAAIVEELGATSLNFKIINGQEVSTSNPNTYTMKVGYGDAVIDQGWYMMVLASEYWLLKRKGLQYTDAFRAVCNELYFTINAIERLDGNAEPIFTNQSQGANLNGFFVRSDHQPDYLSELNRNNIPFNPIEWIGSGGVSGPEFSFIDSSNGIRVYDIDSFRININNSDDNFQCWWQGGPGSQGSHQNWGNEMSQDQVYGLLMGFKAILNWVDADLGVDPDGSDPTLPAKNIHQWIKTITHRIMLHISKTRVGLFGVADQDDMKKEAEQECSEITKYPYFKRDTIKTDSFFYYIRDTVFPYGIIDSAYEIVHHYKDTISEYWFSGSTYRICDVWQKTRRNKGKQLYF